jgi:hypothetical protein
MSILETLASVATAKVVAAAAATTLAVGGAAGLSIAQDAADDEAAIPTEVPVGEGAENADNADRRADGRPETEQEVEVDEVETPELDTENEGRAAEVHASLTEDGELTPEHGKEFGQAVADHARNGEPGAFGRSIADDASNGAGEGRGSDASTDVEGDDRSDEAKERRPETPAAEDRRPEDTPAEGEGSESRVDGEETAETAPHGQAGERP